MNWALSAVGTGDTTYAEMAVFVGKPGTANEGKVIVALPWSNQGGVYKSAASHFWGNHAPDDSATNLYDDMKAQGLIPDDAEVIVVGHSEGGAQAQNLVANQLAAGEGNISTVYAVQPITSANQERTTLDGVDSVAIAVGNTAGLLEFDETVQNDTKFETNADAIVFFPDPSSGRMDGHLLQASADVTQQQTGTYTPDLSLSNFLDHQGESFTPEEYLDDYDFLVADDALNSMSSRLG